MATVSYFDVGRGELVSYDAPDFTADETRALCHRYAVPADAGALSFEDWSRYQDTAMAFGRFVVEHYAVDVDAETVMVRGDLNLSDAWAAFVDAGMPGC